MGVFVVKVLKPFAFGLFAKIPPVWLDAITITLTALLIADVAISAGVLTKIRGAAESVRADNTEAITKAVREALMAQGILLRHPLHAFPEVQFYNKAHLARLKAKHDELQANMRENARSSSRNLTVSKRSARRSRRAKVTRKLISILLILLIFSSAALADVPVLDLRAHDADARFPSDAAVLTVAFPQMTFADAAILVCDGHAGMIDAGGYAEESAVQTALETLGVTRLDWVVATHPHHDHQPGFEAIARRMPIGRFLTSFPANENVQMQHTLAVMAECGVPVENASDGQMLTLGHAQITLILPENTGKTVNNRSLLALVTLGDARMLMLADLESMGQQALLDSSDDVHADILKYPHHVTLP